MSSVPPPSEKAPLVSSSEKPTKLKEEAPADSNIPENYVSWTIKNQKELPPITWNNWWRELNYISCAVLTITPAIAIWGLFNIKLRWETVVFSVFYYYVTGLGEYSHFHIFWLWNVVLCRTYREKGVSCGFFHERRDALAKVLGE